MMSPLRWNSSYEVGHIMRLRATDSSGWSMLVSIMLINYARCGWRWSARRRGGSRSHHNLRGLPCELSSALRFPPTAPGHRSLFQATSFSQAAIARRERGRARFWSATPRGINLGLKRSQRMQEERKNGDEAIHIEPSRLRPVKPNADRPVPDAMGTG
jgi:hypothetical protein